MVYLREGNAGANFPIVGGKNELFARLGETFSISLGKDIRSVPYDNLAVFIC